MSKIQIQTLSHGLNSLITDREFHVVPDNYYWKSLFERHKGKYARIEEHGLNVNFKEHTLLAAFLGVCGFGSAITITKINETPDSLEAVVETRLVGGRENLTPFHIVKVPKSSKRYTHTYLENDNLRPDSIYHLT